MNLEDFIKNNRSEMDYFEPKNVVWEKIEQKLATKQPKLVPIHRLWQVAAAVAILTGFFMYEFNQSQEFEIAQNKVEKNAELVEAERFYQREIQARMVVLRQYDVQDEMLYEDFRSELAILDSAYKNLGDELLENTHQEQVVGAMVQNLQLRLELINQQLNIVQQIQQFKKTPKNHEKSAL